jgi:cullin-associated NEDD8-dissociated protein 1
MCLLRAECFGRLALLHPAEVVQKLQQGLGSDAEQTRGVVVGAVKYMVVDRPHPIDDLLKVGWHVGVVYYYWTC